MRFKRTAILAVVASVIAVIGGVAWAAIPDSSGVIHGCYKTSGPAKGAVVVVDSEAGETCPSGTAPLNWNQTGSQGPAGPPGGVAGYEIVHNSASVPLDQTGINHSIQVLCPTGKRALGGGGSAPVAPFPDFFYAQSRPLTTSGIPTDPAVGWFFQVKQSGGSFPGGTAEGLSVWAICATVA